MPDLIAIHSQQNKLRPLPYTGVARLDELESAFRLRYEVYIEEMQRQQRWADHTKRDIREPLDETGHILVYRQEQQVVGTCRVNFSDRTKFDDADFHHLAAFDQMFPGRIALATKMIVQRQHRKKMAFLELAREVIRQCVQEGCAALVIDTNEYLLDAFGQMGFVAYDSVMHPQYGSVSLMVLFFQDTRHLERIRSPFRDLITKRREGLHA